MKQATYNHLLLKDDVGRAKPTTRALPPQYFIYGRAEIRDKEGASEGMNKPMSNITGYSCVQLALS